MADEDREPKAQDEERPADTGDQGDWGNAARWVVFGNRPNPHREEIEREEKPDPQTRK